MSSAWLSFEWLNSVRRRPTPLSKLLVLTGTLALGAPGCAADDASDGGGDTPIETAGLEFLEEDTLELRPKEVATLRIQTDSYADVSILLLGNTLDASLPSAIIHAGKDGLATVELTAPSQPTTFVVRAQLGNDAADELHVSVSEQGFTTLKVMPSYNGKRSLDSYAADVVVGGSCDAILAGYPTVPVGGLHVDGSSSTLAINSVPVGSPLAVAVRSGVLAAGCVTYTAATPESQEQVSITLLDRPIALDETELELTLDYTPDGESYAGMVKDAGKIVADAAYPEQTPVASLLLDTMAQLLAPEASANLSQLRQESSLNTDLQVMLEGLSLHEQCSLLALGGSDLARYDAESGSIKLKGVIRGTQNPSGPPVFMLDRVGSLDASQLAIPEQIAFTWSATPDDVLVISGLVPISMTRLAAAYMNDALNQLDGEGGEGDGDLITTPVALQEAVDCQAVATQINYSGEIAGCDTDCLAIACNDAINARWEAGIAAGDSSDGSLGSLQVGISGDTSIDTDLVATRLDGTWLGTLSSLDKTSTIMGAAEGQAPPPR